MDIRAIKSIKKGQPVLEGAGVKVVRILSNKDVEEFDPFLLLDVFDSDNPEDYINGFPWHPHRGIETVTYLINGEIQHGDSLGNSGTIYDGDCQWMTAGSGIIHQEMPQKTERIKGLQLWLNLPAKDKMTHPKYRDITHDKIPTIKNDGFQVKVISGIYDNIEGAMQADYVKARLLDMSVNPNQELVHQTENKNKLFIYIISGACRFGENSEKHNQRNAILFDFGDFIKIKTESEGVRLIIFEANPLNEPIAWGGPIVMNTREELEKAFTELKTDEFIKHKI